MLNRISASLSFDLAPILLLDNQHSHSFHHPLLTLVSQLLDEYFSDLLDERLLLLCRPTFRLVDNTMWRWAYGELDGISRKRSAFENESHLMGGGRVREDTIVACMTIDELVNSLNNQRTFPSGEKLAYIFRINPSKKDSTSSLQLHHRPCHFDIRFLFHSTVHQLVHALSYSRKKRKVSNYSLQATRNGSKHFATPRRVSHGPFPRLLHFEV
jgi:hypothetical protein